LSAKEEEDEEEEKAVEGGIISHQAELSGTAFDAV
jgi:hypothetical protein